jgi:tRNA (guanosine-2'-O-)-methyltransferase
VNEEIYARLFEMLSESKQHLVEKNAARRTRHLTVAVEHLYQSHNTSAVIRSCDCFGLQDVYIIARQQYKVNRDIAMGAGKWITEHSFQQGETEACLREIKNKGYKLVATSPHAEMSLFDLPVDQPVCLLFGAEKHGLSEVATDMADEVIHIPMFGFTESFNISVSVALCLQILRQKMEQEVHNWQLSEADQLELKLQWCRNILRNGDAVYEEVKRLLEAEHKSNR